ncbi:hypothetical protein [Rhizobium sp. RU35A]|uniref:hypothetical protein n=1 Tax=Rhizobium sp. RU35A TaxID=1907414 RepID=UPI00122D3A85|nr:hypothetical protein [Rhizobium sp. RU35A]
MATLDRSWGSLFKLHNEHMITLPKLIYGLDTVVANGTGLISIVLVWLFQIGSCALLVSLAPKPRLLGIPLVVCLMFWGRHLENLSWSFQVGFVGLCFVAIATMYLVTVPQRWAYWAALILGGSAPLWSLNGFLVPLLVGAVLLMLRSYARALSFVIVCGAAAWLHYQAGFGTKSHDVSLAMVIAVYLDIVGRPFLELFVPVTRHLKFNDVSTVTMILAALVHAGVLATAWHAYKRRSPQLLALVAISLFGLGSCLMAAIGRADQYDGPAYRYAVFTVLGVAPVLLIGLGGLRTAFPSQGLSTAICIAIATNATVWWQFAEMRGNIEKQAIAAIKAAPDDPASYKLLYPSPQGIWPRIMDFRAQKRSIFAE